MKKCIIMLVIILFLPFNIFGEEVDLTGVWEDTRTNNHWQMDVKWNQTSNQYEGTLIKNGVMSEYVGFTIGELVWIATPTSNVNELSEQQKWRTGANGVSSGFDWRDGIVYLTQTTNLTLVTSQSTFKKINAVESDTVDLNDGLVAHYPFNGNADDESGNENHGTVNGASLAEDRFGLSNSAYRFDGVNDDITSDASLSSTQLTASAWILIDQHHCWGGIIDAFQEKWEFVLDCEGQNKLEFAPWNNNSWDDIVDSQSLALKEWYHVVVVVDQLVGSFYINGVKSSSFSLGSTISVEPSTLIIGHSRSGTSQYFEGLIDDIRLYDRALSEFEIQELYLEGESEDGVEGYDEGYEAGKQYCIENPEECGIAIGSDYQTGYEQGYIDGEATCNDEVECTQVITYAQVPDTDCWVMFSTPCDVPEGWKIVYEEPSNLCGSVEGTSSENADSCSTFDIFSNTLHVPCFNGGSIMYWLDLELTGSEPVTLELKDIGTN